MVVNVCEAGHSRHLTKLVETKVGPMYVYKKQRDNPGLYCNAQDATSLSLTLEGEWERHDTKVIERILKKGDRSRLFIDFGCHLGWYTIIAAKLGYQVLAIDADKENLRNLKRNLELQGLQDRVEIRHQWVDKDFPQLDLTSDVELVKIDIEGNERFAVESMWPMIERISNLYVEISPAFNDHYPALVDRLTEAGYRAYYPDGREFDNDYSLTQINLHFKNGRT